MFHLFLSQGFPGYKCPEPNCEAVPFCLNYLDLHLHDVHGKQHPSEDLSQARLGSKDLIKSEEGKKQSNTTFSAKEKTLSSQEQALTEPKTLPKLSCILCKNVFNSQMILKTHMKDEHKMSNEKINQVLCKLWMENNKKELEANSVSSDSSRDNFLRERTKTNFRNDSIKFQNQVLSKLWMENKKKELPGNSVSTESIEGSKTSDSQSNSKAPGVMHIAENILGSINDFLLEHTSKEVMSLEESVKNDLPIVKKEEVVEKMENVEEIDKMEKVEELEELEVERVDWLEEVEKRMMSAGSIFHCTECKFTSKEENKLVEHVLSDHLPAFPGFRCPVLECQVDIH